MPQLPREIVKARASRLRDAVADRRSRWLDSLIGTRQRMLVEGPGKGHSDSFAPVLIEGAKRGEILDVRIAGRNGDSLAAVRA